MLLLIANHVGWKTLILHGANPVSGRQKHYHK
jgi:hypothetical protein